MLVLSRQRDQSIIIGDGPNKVTITIVDIRGDKCRIGIDGPKEVPIHREEVYNAIQEQHGAVKSGASFDPKDRVSVKKPSVA